MYKNPTYIAFLSILGLILLWYSADFGWKYWTYSSLNSQTAPNQVDLKVVESSHDNFHYLATYTFQANDQLYTGTTLLKLPRYRNSYAAAQDMSRFKQETKWEVHFNSSNPKYSSLQKSFPFKECLYAALLWALLAYFYYLGTRAAKG